MACTVQNKRHIHGVGGQSMGEKTCIWVPISGYIFSLQCKGPFEQYTFGRTAAGNTCACIKTCGGALPHAHQFQPVNKNVHIS